ncbi:MAG: hypothetical protein WBC05_17345, partial [Sedimentisphaerales bacterium]
VPILDSRTCRFAILLVADKAINVIGCSGSEQPDFPQPLGRYLFFQIFQFCYQHLAIQKRYV